MKVLTVPGRARHWKFVRIPQAQKRDFSKLHGNPPRKTGRDREGQDGGGKILPPHFSGIAGGMGSFLPFR